MWGPWSRCPVKSTHAHSAYNDPEATTGAVRDIFRKSRGYTEKPQRRLRWTAAEEPVSETVIDDQGMLLQTEFFEACDAGSDLCSISMDVSEMD